MSGNEPGEPERGISTDHGVMWSRRGVQCWIRLCETAGMEPLERRPLGSLLVSTLSLGAMPFGGGFSQETRIDEDLARALVNTALDAGVNLIDTGESYGGGRSEAILGRVICGRRDEVLVATKVGFGDLGPGALSHGNVIRACEGSLRRLGIEHIDLYQLHRADRTV